MAEFGRVCGGQADLFRAILARISHLNKLPTREALPLGSPRGEGGFLGRATCP
jgi:hypothetical protein